MIIFISIMVSRSCRPSVPVGARHAHTAAPAGGGGGGWRHCMGPGPAISIRTTRYSRGNNGISQVLAEERDSSSQDNRKTAG